MQVGSVQIDSPDAPGSLFICKGVRIGPTLPEKGQTNALFVGRDPNAKDDEEQKVEKSPEEPPDQHGTLQNPAF